MLEYKIATHVTEAVKVLWNVTLSTDAIQIQKTRKEFEGDLTVVVFPLTRFSGKNPEQTASEIGSCLLDKMPELKKFNVIKGFLNLVISERYWWKFFIENYQQSGFGFHKPRTTKPVLIEYSSPNTNKPLHLGHIRNNLLGYSLSKILEANGQPVVRVNLVNDRGIHICKSMLAWMKWGNGETPETSGIKGDHLVGKYYVMFETHYREQINQLINEGIDPEVAEKEAPLIQEAQQLLRKWEMNDPEVRKVWTMMNSWVYQGFDETYKRLGVHFDKIYYESDTYLLGRKLVEEGLQKNIFYRKPDGSVWCDLTDEGLDEKVLLRADGTSVYITQDLGTAQLRIEEFNPEKLIYVVGNEQNYHFEVLKKILKRLGRPWADHIFHFSYGMVELPHGKMKSREGTVVDADDLLDEMYHTAEEITEKLGKSSHLPQEEKHHLYQIIGLGALKYFILKVDPRKNMLFNPEESIDFDGNTGPFIQYTHARIRSLFRKAEEKNLLTLPPPEANHFISLSEKEISIIKLLHDFPDIVNEAATTLSPALVANYVYELAKEYNQFYQEVPIIKEEDQKTAIFRLYLSGFTGNVIRSAMSLLGIEVPEMM